MKIVNFEQHNKMLERNCSRGKHRLRTNKYGITWCVICGHLCTGNVIADPLTEDDKIMIKNDTGTV